MSRKLWVLVGGLIVLYVIGFVIAAASFFGSVVLSSGGDWREERIEGSGDQKVAIVRIAGEITSGTAAGGLLAGETAGADDILSQLRQAGEDDSVAAVILRLETPGGEVVASDDIYREVERLNRDKPVVASMGDLAASGGYYVAAGARRIVANPSTWTGSIGVIAVLPNVQGAADKLGVKASIIKSGAFKDAGSPLRDLTPAERDYFQSLIDQAYNRFLEVVAAGRTRPVDEIRPLADGRVYSGIQAKDNGLVDELGDLETAYDAALKLAKLDREESTLVEYRSGPSLSDLFSPGLRSPVGEVKKELGLGFGAKYLFLPGA